MKTYLVMYFWGTMVSSTAMVDAKSCRELEARMVVMTVPYGDYSKFRWTCEQHDRPPRPTSPYLVREPGRA